MGSVAIQHWGISVLDFSGMVHDDDLGVEKFNLFGRIVRSIGSDVSSLDVLNRYVLDVESNIVSWDSFSQFFMMHFNTFTFSADHDGGESDVHSWLNDSSFNSSDGDSSDTSDLVHILKGKSKRLIGGSGGGDDIIEGIEESLSLIPGGHLFTLFQHVFSSPSGNGDEGDSIRLISDLFQENLSFIDDFSDSFLSVVDSLFINLVDTDDHLFDSQSEGQKSVFSGLTILGDSGFEFSDGGSNHQHGTIGL